MHIKPAETSKGLAATTCGLLASDALIAVLPTDVGWREATEGPEFDIGKSTEGYCRAQTSRSPARARPEPGRRRPRPAEARALKAALDHLAKPVLHSTSHPRRHGTARKSPL